ncbi:MAG: flagellar hook-length control protein FliK [Cellvibrionaceae bacterium]
MINLPPKPSNNTNTNQLITEQGRTTALKNTQTNTSSTSNVSEGENIAVKSLLIKQIQQGQTLTAQVKSTQLLNQNDKSLLQKLNPSVNQSLAQTVLNSNKASTSSITSSNISNVLNQNGLNQNSSTSNTNLYLTKLVVNQNHATPQLLTTISPQLLAKNTNVLLGQNNGELTIKPQQNQQIQTIVSELAKLNLPKQQPISQSQQFVNQFNKLPLIIQQQLFSSNAIKSDILQAVKTLSTFIHSDKTLSNTNQVKEALATSGIQLEAKIKQHLPISQDIRTNIDKVITILSSINSAVKTTNSINNQTLIETGSLANQLGQGITTKELDKILTSLLSQQVSTNATQSHHPQQAALPNSTAALFRLFGLALPPDNNQKIPLPQIIERHLRKLMEQAQARIQLNQLQSLGLDKIGSESKASILQQFHTEIALRFNEQVLPLQINIQEQENKREKEDNDDQNAQNDSDSVKSKRWQVFLSFDLPDNEKLHTQLTIIDNSISATLWAESSNLCNKANQEINILRDKFLAKGLVVDDLTCIHGKPVQQEFELGYNLVDITT